MLVHSWKYVSPTEVIKEKIILEGIHLWLNISLICYKKTVLKLI